MPPWSSVTEFHEAEALFALYNWEQNIDFDYPEEEHPQWTDLASMESLEVPIVATIQEMLQAEQRFVPKEEYQEV